jgi:hypothetical protein
MAMTRRFKLAIAMCAGLVAMPALSYSAFAIDLAQQATQNAVQNAADLQALQNQIQRQQYQQQQQFNRQIDRNNIVPQQPRQPAVPIVRQNCQAQGYGSGRMSVCR